MTPTQIIQAILQSRFSDTYEFGSAYMQHDDSHVADIQRMLHTTQDLITRSLYRDKIRAMVRTSQSDYVAVSGVDTITVTWSVEFAAPVGDMRIGTDIDRVRRELTGTLAQVVDADGRSFRAGLTFVSSVDMTAAQTINGVSYTQVIWGGRAIISDKSAIADDIAVEIDGYPVIGLLSVAGSYTPEMQAFHAAGSALIGQSVPGYSNGFSIQIHSVVGDPVADKLLAIAFNSAQAVNAAVKIRYRDGAYAWDFATVSAAQVSASLGSYVVLDAQIMR